MKPRRLGDMSIVEPMSVRGRLACPDFHFLFKHVHYYYCHSGIYNVDFRYRRRLFIRSMLYGLDKQLSIEDTTKILFETKLGIRHFYLVKVARDRDSRSRMNEKDITHEIMRDHKINLGRLIS